jgi:hypothetical protein
LRRSGDVYGLVVEYLRGEVGTVGPGDRSELRIDPDLGEALLISQWLEDGPNRSLKPQAEVKFAHQAVGEGQPEAVPAELLDGADVVRTAHGSGSMVGSGCSAMALSQSAANSSRCNSTYSRTSAMARRGREPWRISPLAMTI